MSIEKTVSKITDTVTQTPSFQRTLDNFFYKYFRKKNLQVEIQRLEDAAYLDSFKKYTQQLEEGCESIPSNYRIEPKKCIADKAYDIGLYYIEERDLINLFRHLIVASMDKRYISKLHPAFVDIIQQLSPVDARNLKFFADKLFNENQKEIPIVDYVYRTNSNYNIFQTNVFLENPEEQDIQIQAVSMDNLSRLQLISIPSSIEKTATLVEDQNLFEKYYQTELFLDSKKQIPNNYQEVDILSGFVELTNFGLDFVTVSFGFIPRIFTNEIE